MYSLLHCLKGNFKDGDVQLMLLVLQTVGQQMRTAEPGSFKTFMEGVETKMAALAGANELSQRSRLMLELIVEMKNSKKIKEKHGAGSLQSNLNADVMHLLRSCNVERVTMHGLTWEQVDSLELPCLRFWKAALIQSINYVLFHVKCSEMQCRYKLQNSTCCSMRMSSSQDNMHMYDVTCMQLNAIYAHNAFCMLSLVLTLTSICS
jgi:hypothetical protein